MGKKSKTNPPARWKELKLDFEKLKQLEKNSSVFEEVTTDDFREQILDNLLKNGKNLTEVLETLVKWKEYLQTRSDKLSDAFNEKTKGFFEEIRVTLVRPFDEAQWQELETMDREDLNKKTILFNGIPTNAVSLVQLLETLLISLDVKVKHAEVFPFDVDSYGLPPINCRKIWNPLLWMRSEIESKIRKHCGTEAPALTKLVTSLAHAPKEGNLEKMAVTSFFLENTADNLDYKDRNDKKSFLDRLKSQFGTLRVDELTLVLPDILIAYTKDLVEGMMAVSYFMPFELLRLVFLCWRPRVVKLRLRTEACSSIEDAARIEWDDEEVFTSTTLFNCELFDRTEPVCLGDEEEILNCKLIVEASGSRLFDAIHNEKNVDTAGRDFLVLFPMRTILIKRTIPLKNSASIKTQVKQQIDFLVSTFLFNAEEHPGRVVNCQLTFTNSEDIQLSMVKKCLPKTVNKRPIGLNYDVEPETRRLFDEFGCSRSEKHMFASFFDVEYQVIIDTKIALTR